MSDSAEQLVSRVRTSSEATRQTRRLDRFWELFEEIATHRRGVHADRMALHLLRFETETRELVALLDDAERAVYYNTARMLLSVRFDKHGVDEGSEELHARALTDPASWLDLYHQRVCWRR
ncbi:hypothetical protein ACFQE1_03750 [Halobium palmae]|uniref:Uncharacterized protein n=1 Tax=Halobium palmae TaxID=1776492 RepID=A0ABD5RXN0_9EURY